MAQQGTIGKTATQVATFEDRTVVFYHSTPVVVFTINEPQKLIQLHNDGWYTVTTKTRMNQASAQFGLGFYVFQEKYRWYVERPDGSVVAFEDGMTFPAKAGG